MTTKELEQRVKELERRLSEHEQQQQAPPPVIIREVHYAQPYHPPIGWVTYPGTYIGNPVPSTPVYTTTALPYFIT